MRDGLVLEAAADAFLGVGQLVVVEDGAHQALFGEGDRHARGVAGDPAAAPLLGDVGGRAGAAGGVEDQVAGVGGHEEAARDDLRQRLDDVYSRWSRTHSSPYPPNVRDRRNGKVGQSSFVRRVLPDR